MRKVAKESQVAILVSMPVPRPRFLFLTLGLFLATSCVVPPTADSIDRLSLEDRVALLPVLRASLDEDLGLVSGDSRSQSAGRNRILNRGRFEGLTIGRGGGAYFSFETGLNDYNQGPDLELQQWQFSSGFYGGSRGLVARLDAESLDEVSLAAIPAELQATRPDRDHAFSRQAADVGGVYAVRAYRPGESDLLAALQVVDRDEYGLTFDWKVLKVYPTPTR